MSRLLSISLLAIFSFTAYSQTNVLTQHNDIGRTGQNLTETVLTPANVSSGNFGLLSSLPIDGPAFAQPLYMTSLNIGGTNHSVVFVASEHDSIYAFDAGAGGQLLWKASLLDTAHGAANGAIPDPESDTGCANANGPEFGITGTPVIDATTNTMYLVSKTFENNYPVQRLHALEVTNGSEKFGGPVTIQATVAGTGNGSINGQLAFDAKWNNQRAGLLLLNGSVYIAWASHCDYGPWHGWVMAYNASTLTQTSAFVTTPNGYGSGIWMSGAGLAADNENGVPRMFVTTGNGSYDAVAPYATNTMDYGDDFLTLNLSNGIKVADTFTPSNQLSLEQQDVDVSAGGLVVLPDNLPGAAVPHEAVQMSKAGVITVLNRDNLGGYNAADQVLQELNPTVGFGAGLWGMPAYWNGNLYFWPSHAAPNYNLLQYKLTNGLLPTSPFAVSTVTDPWTNGQFLGANPSISANQNTNGIVWVDDTGNNLGGSPQFFYALDATNVANTLWSSTANPRDNAGIEQHFAFPTIADGRVFLPSIGNLLVYGLLDFSMSAPSSIAVNPGNNTVATIGLASSNSFTQGVTFSATGLPAGVTVGFSSSAAGSETAVFTAAASAASGTSNVTITASRGTTTKSATTSVTVGAVTDFAVAASPVSVNLGTTGYSAIVVTPLNGFSGIPAYSAVNLPAGITAQFAGSSRAGSTLLLTASQTISTGTYPVTIQATSGSLTHIISTTVTIVRTAVANVNLAPYYNVAAIATNGTSPGNGGLDGQGYAFSGNLLGTTLTWAGTTFNLGPANQPDAVSNQTVALPAGKFVNLQMLASGGSAGAAPVVVTYSDGSSTTFTQSFSNWGSPTGYSGESVALTSAYRVIPAGTTQNGPWYIYGYAFPLNSAKTVSSVTLPPTSSVVVMALALSSVSSAAQTIIFNPISAQPVGGALALTAIASSGLPVSYASSTTNVCSVSGSTASLVGAGTCSITASQTGNSTYAAASASQSFAVGAGSSSQQVQVNLANISNIYAVANVGTAPANGGLDTAGYAYAANLLGSSVSWSGTTFALGQAGVADAVSSVQIPLPAGQFSSLKILATAAFGNQVNQPFILTYSDGTTSTYSQSISDWGSPQNVAGESVALGMPYRVAPDGTTQAVITWNLFGYTIPVTAGKSLVSLTLPNNRSIVVLAVTLSSSSLAAQTISFGAIANYPVGTSLTLAATASSGLPVTYASSTSSVCTLTGSALSLIGVGTCTITASQPGNVAYAPAVSVSQSFSVTSAVQIAQAITFSTIASYPVGVSVTLTSTASSGLPVNYASSTTSVCTVSGSTLSPIGVGTCTVAAFQGGNGTYSAAPTVTQSFTVTARYTALVNLAPYYNTYALATNGTSPLGSGVDGYGYAFSANLLGSSLTWSGTTFNLGPANQLDAAASQTITLPAGNFLSLQMLATGAGAAAQPVVVTYTDGSSSTFTQGFSNWGYPAGYAGESVALASAYRVIPGGTTQNGPWYIYGYNFPLKSAKTVSSVKLPPTGNVVVIGMALTSASPINQSITFGTIANQTVGTTLNLAATASSGLPVTFISSTTGICAVSANTVQLNNPGTCTIAASQAGNATFAAASVSQSFTVNAKGSFTLAAASSNVTVTPPTCFFSCFGGVSATNKITVTPSGGFTGAVSVVVSGLPAGVTAAFSPTSVTGSGSTTFTLTPSSSAAKNQSTTLTITGTSVSGSSVISAATSFKLSY